MSTLGTVFPNNGYPQHVKVYRIVPEQVKSSSTNDVAKQLVEQILKTPKGQQILTRFLSQKTGFWKPILSNPKLTPSQKFKKIFGIDFLDIFSPSGLSGGLGNIFEDIGNWFNSGGAERLAIQIQNTAGNIANALNILKNKTQMNSNIQTQQSLLDIQNKGILTVSDIIQNYGIWIIGGLVVLLFLKK